MAIVKGTVEAYNTKFDKYSILVDGTWYSTKIEWAKVKPVKGDVVEFDDGGGKYTKNLKITSKGGESAPSASAPATGRYGSKFPIAPDDGQRSIIRQNALTNAREFYTTVLCRSAGDTGCLEEEALSSHVEKILFIARQFEMHTAGDIDRLMSSSMTEGMDG